MPGRLDEETGCANPAGRFVSVHGYMQRGVMSLNEPIRWWAFRDAPEHLTRYDNGGDEDWLFHVPASWRNGPLSRCPEHERAWSWACPTCESERHCDPPLRNGWIDWSLFAVCGLDWYEQDDGSLVCITHHA